MTYLEAFIFGVIQGIAEFLPVSSSGHLLVLKQFMDLQEVPVLFDVLLHLATLLVVVVVFRQRIGELFSALIRFKERKTDKEVQKGLYVIGLIMISTLITVVMGFSIEQFEVENYPAVVYGLFVFTGTFLFLGRKFQGEREFNNTTMKSGILVGIAQGIGVLPGVSRSGITITTGVFNGMSRKAAADYSFIISIPVILGAAILKLKEAEGLSQAVAPPVLLFSFAVTVIVGYVALKLLMKVLNSGKFHYFSFYLIPLGIWGLIRSFL